MASLAVCRACRPAASRTAARFSRLPLQRPRFQTRFLATASSSENLDPAKYPLAGIRVLDLTRVLAGIMGDLGAEVIKVEHPLRGDDTRAWGPPYAPYSADSSKDGPGESAYFLSANRNKKSVGVSFQNPEGVKILHNLAKECDVLVENYLPGSLKKYGLDFATLHELNPSLIYASITGYGQTGPYSNRAGYDVMVEAEFGLMHITGERDGPPVKVGVAITDMTTGLYTSNSVLAALLQRHNNGNKGQHLDVALSDCQMASLTNIAMSVLVTGKKDGGRWGTSHPSIVPYRAFAASDGAILIGGGNDKLFGILCRLLDRPDWATDARFATNSARVQNRAALEADIEAITRTRSVADWLAAFDGSGMPYGPVNDVKQTLEHPHAIARNMVVAAPHPECGEMKLLNTPVKWSGATPGVRSAPPTLGQHTQQILGGLLGMRGEEIEALKRDGVVS